MRNTLQQWLDWMEEIHPAEIELGLDRVYSVAKNLMLSPLDFGGIVPSDSNLEKPRLASHIVIVAGTNGKGSTIAALQNIVHQTGMSSLVYTSPHFEHYTERFEYNCKPVAEIELLQVLEKIETARDRTPLTFFEYSTLAALQLCMDLQPDVAILEVGLGGRLDAINIVPADIAIITQIDLDHQDWLGDTRELIGAEKAGILRKGVNFICADRQPTTSVTSKADALGAKAYYLGEDFDLQGAEHGWLWTSPDTATPPIAVADTGLHPNSVAAALKAFELIRKDSLSVKDVSGLQQVKLQGRQQRLALAGKQLLLDVAHNPAAIAHLRSTLLKIRRTTCAKSYSAENEAGAARIIAVFAVMGDKAWDEMLDLISDVIDSWFLAKLPGNQRAESNETIAAYFSKHHPDIAAIAVESVAEAIESALVEARPQDQVVVFGSFFTVAAAFEYIRSIGEFDG